MKREAFDHSVRAAGSVLGEDQVLVIGSQALHATVADHLPPEAERSVEADVAAFDDPDDRKADLIDGSIGEVSMFHETFGYYAQGVSTSTAELPADGAIDWFDTNHRRRTESLPGVSTCTTCGCRRRSPLRPKNIEFCAALATRRYVDADTLQTRLGEIADLSDARRTRVRRLIEVARSAS